MRSWGRVMGGLCFLYFAWGNVAVDVWMAAGDAGCAVTVFYAQRKRG